MPLYELPTPVVTHILKQLTSPLDVGCFINAIENDERYVHHYLQLLQQQFQFINGASTTSVVGLVLKEHVGVLIRSQEAPSRRSSVYAAVIITALNVVLAWLFTKLVINMGIFAYHGTKWAMDTFYPVYEYGGWKSVLAVVVGLVSLPIIEMIRISRYSTF
ncbi:hypothetical protein DIURU_003992 [Diutina rugosa]|uniref:Uncharacterized protein n=1 Tax=Diutina rugosa TaxID=5481 RepID=A0A642UJ57_DIURU|nr:uncharacterized protein DIURU_003992 [Diutina rugosa]KAA8900044.1 hypothetical protein DIURU_003992 [Diutina rugosa]